MTHREQILEILSDAGIEYSQSGGDSVITHGCRLVFSPSGALRQIGWEGGEEDYDDDY